MTEPVWLDSPQAIEEYLRDDIPHYDLEEPGVRIIMCAPDDQIMTQAQINDPTEEELAELADEGDDGLGNGSDAAITRFLSHFRGWGGSILVALVRPSGLAITEDDRASYRAARAVCSKQEWRLLGVHVVTPRGLREIVLDDAL